MARTLYGFEPITDTGDHASINGNASVKRQQLLLPQRVNIVTGYFSPLPHDRIKKIIHIINIT